MSEIETSLIGLSRGDASGDTFYASNPATGEQLAVAYASASDDEVDRAAELAEKAAGSLAALSGAEKASFLRT
ncbi:MAG: aldehyde dehydrogenase (NADP(+)), partial [Verrucomicrobia bacterium]|nr:aldehyde dehydrogenase (NADP(+)) [Verrucomicrobiota bacterium]